MSFNPLSLVPFILFIIFLYKWLYSTRKLRLLPPSPPKLPIIGHLHKLGKFPHRSLQPLSHKYGELLMLYSGNKPTLVVSSAKAAEEIMKTHDLIFANKPKLRSIKRIFYDFNDLAFSSYGEKWRYLKSICVMKLLNNKKIQSFRIIREEEIARMIEKIRSNYNCGSSSVLNLSEALVTVFIELICMTALGKKYENDDLNFHQLLKDITKVMGSATSVGDYIPMLSLIDRLTGMEARVENVGKQFDIFLENVIQEHQVHGHSVKHFVDVLLEIHRDNPQQLSRDNIKALILDIFVGGAETSSTTLEWAMTELIRHPKALKILQEEIRGIVKGKERVTEDDLENMKYLRAVIKETLRLHPPAPLMAFRESSKDVKIDKYDIAARTQVIINAWAIQRDPKYWKEPEDFNPDRFLNNTTSVDFRGQNFEFIPFGAGRRGCPGMSLGIVSSELVLASLLNEFNWALPNGREGKTLDVEESWGINVQRRNPLMVVATPIVPAD